MFRLCRRNNKLLGATYLKACGQGLNATKSIHHAPRRDQPFPVTVILIGSVPEVNHVPVHQCVHQRKNSHLPQLPLQVACHKPLLWKIPSNPSKSHSAREKKRPKTKRQIMCGMSSTSGQVFSLQSPAQKDFLCESFTSVILDSMTPLHTDSSRRQMAMQPLLVTV